jgi:hypothetical protein
MNEDCNCDCHKSEGMMKHVVACCFNCPHCLRNIDTLGYSDHVKKCEADIKSLLNSNTSND